jgi:triacylglycerol lipase
MPEPSTAVAEVVVLLHGIAMPAAVMQPVARALRADGFRTINLPYPSRRLTLDALARDYLPARLRAAGAEKAARLHFVGHSMGAILVRLHLENCRPANLGRVVLLGPPNAGSIVADRLSRLAPARWLLGPNLLRLGTAAAGACPNRRAPPDCELGIIAGRASLNPVFSRWHRGENDGVVSVESARLDGARTLLVVPYSHSGMLFRRAVAAQVVAFLRTGRFI